MAAKVGQAPVPAARRARRKAPPPPPPKAWWRRWWDRPRARRRVLALALLAVIGLTGYVVARLFVVPRAGVPPRADAVVTLSDDEAEVTRALELMNSQVAPVLVVAGGADPSRALAYRLCTQPQPFEVDCRANEPPPTSAASATSATSATSAPSSPAPPARDLLRDQPEAQTVGRLATERGWSQLALVGFPEQLSRARLLVERCTTADVTPVMVETPVSRRLAHLGGEAADYLRALFLDRSC